jgi:uncharacterized protein (TIGR02270 family)
LGDTKAMRIGLIGFAVHRQDPGPILADAIKGSEPRLRARALKAAGELGRANLISLLLDLLSDKDEACKYYAAWSVARLGQQNDRVINALKEIALGLGNYCEQATDMVMRVLDINSARIWYRDLLKNPDRARSAVIGLGSLGVPDFMDDLFLLMEKEVISRVAGEAFSMITGADIDYEDLDGEEPEGFEAGPSEKAEDENIEMDPDEDLPWPNPEMTKKWWLEHRNDFRPGVRYLRGKEINSGSLMDALIHGNQRQRYSAALEMAIREPLKPLFEIRAPGKRQSKLLK